MATLCAHSWCSPAAVQQQSAFVPTQHFQMPPCLQVTDGAAAVMLMTRQEAAKRGLPILGIFRRWGMYTLMRKLIP